MYKKEVMSKSKNSDSLVWQFLSYATIHAKRSANAEKFTHGEEHLKLIPPKVFWIICIERIPLNMLKRNKKPASW